MMNQTTAAKNANISARLLTLVNSGMTVPEAFDAVLGKGAYMKMAGELYDALKAKGA